jgi:hypothetical protein
VTTVDFKGKRKNEKYFPDGALENVQEVSLVCIFLPLLPAKFFLSVSHGNIKSGQTTSKLCTLRWLTEDMTFRELFLRSEAI